MGEMKLIVKEILKQQGKTIADLATALKPEGPSYRTIYAFINRGGGSLEVGAQIAQGMGKKLDEIYVNKNYIIPKLTGKEDNFNCEKAAVPLDVVLKALISFENPVEVQKAIARLGKEKLFDVVQMCTTIAKEYELNSQKQTGGD